MKKVKGSNKQQLIDTKYGDCQREKGGWEGSRRGVKGRKMDGDGRRRELGW